MINPDKYHRTIGLVCPTCGGTQFEHSQGDARTVEAIKCASCGREMTKDTLIEENSENISAHANEIGKEAVKDITDEFRQSLRRTFSGSKFIKIK